MQGLNPGWKIVCIMPSIIYLRSWWLMILKNQSCFVSLFISCFIIEQSGSLILCRACYSFHIAINLVISLWVHSLLPLRLFLTFIRRARGYGGLHYWRNTTITCSWFCTILLEFFSICLRKISFSFSSNARLPFSILKENRRYI